MGQIKIFGLSGELKKHQALMSDVIHECVVDSLRIPTEKRFHRFFLLNKEDFYFPSDRTEKHTIIEISLFEGRTTETKARLIRLLFSKITQKVGIR